MAVIFFYMIFMLAMISNNEIVFKGATDGLMLWFNNVIPLLLPFMLMSALIAKHINNLPSDLQKTYAVLITLFTGILCGYPLGAKNSAEFVKRNAYSKETGNLLCPLCSNCSPMFLSGYIINYVLNKKVSFFKAIILICLPYIFCILIVCFFNKVSGKKKDVVLKPDFDNKTVSGNNNEDLVLSTIIQITYVGFYIIICSIISEMILSLNLVSLYSDICNHFNLSFNVHMSSFIEKLKTLLSGITEITKGTFSVSTSSVFSLPQKEALVLSVTSFGGISALLQTKAVIKDSGLSIKYYILTKTICAFATYGLSLIIL